MQLLGMANAWKGWQSTKSVLFPGASACDSTDSILLQVSLRRSAASLLTFVSTTTRNFTDLGIP
jgi:hypothetical protein